MSNKTRRKGKGRGNSKRPKGNRGVIGNVKDPYQGNAQLISYKQSKTALGRWIQNSIGLLDRHQRPMSLGHVATSAFIGALVGGLLALWVIHVTGNFSTPWTYMLNLGSALLLKVVLQWIWTIWINPFADRQARLFVVNRTGQELPHLRRDKSQGGGQQVQSLVTTVIAAIGVATVLVTTKELTPDWLLEPTGIIFASASIGALTLVAEALSTQTTIYALWKNRHEYQETLAYQDKLQSKRKDSPRIKMTLGESTNRRLIEEWLPINEISVEAIRERAGAVPNPAPHQLHVWWARRPLAPFPCGCGSLSAQERSFPRPISGSIGDLRRDHWKTNSK